MNGESEAKLLEGVDLPQNSGISRCADEKAMVLHFKRKLTGSEMMALQRFVRRGTLIAKTRASYRELRRLTGSQDLEAALGAPEGYIAWLDEAGVTHVVSCDQAACDLQALYGAWPSGLYEIESEIQALSRSAAIMGTLAHEVMLGAVKTEDLVERTRDALERAGLLDLERVTALAAKATEDPE